MILGSKHNIHFTSQYHVAASHKFYRLEDAERFWSKVDTDGAGGCWLWLLSAMDSCGHGQFTVRRDGKQSHLYAHRVAWELTNGPIPEGLKVCHKCDVPPCVNPLHLFLGTQADNLNDARAKGRLIDGLANRKLSDDAYREILTTTGRGSGKALAAKYGVARTTISRIRHGQQGSTFHRIANKVVPIHRPLKPEPAPSDQPTRPFELPHGPFERVPHVFLNVRGDVG